MALAVSGLSGLLHLAAMMAGPQPDIPDFARVRSDYQASEAVLLDRHGEVLHELRVDPRARRLEWVRLSDISPCLTRTVLFAEDRAFYRHRGVDLKAVAGALLRKGRPRGASTISMQVVPLLDRRLKPHGPRRSWPEKFRQIRAARALEKAWSKPQILEAYLNLVTFRGELQGLRAASRGILGKEPSGINDREALVLAALIPEPQAPLRRTVARAKALGASLGIACGDGELMTLVRNTVGHPYRVRPGVALAPHVARMLLSQNRRRVVSTLDKGLQAFVSETLARQVAALNARNVHDGAALVVDNQRGDILAYAGNTGAGASAPLVDGIRAPRQAGSTLKPLLYELALEREVLTAASILDDSALQIPTPTGLYIPEDYDQTYAGEVSVRTALASSLNIPAVRTLQLIGLDGFVERLRATGFSGIRKEADYYGYSLALGSVDVSLLDLVGAYRVLANHGVCSPLSFLPDQGHATQTRVMDERAVFIISAVLSDRDARAHTFGLENYLATRFWTAVKTGTSKDMRDNWCIGYSERFTVGVWVGNFSGEPMWNVSGVSGAAPVWLEIMNHLHRDLSSAPPRPPKGLIRKAVRFAGSIEPARTEWFLEGTEPPGIIRLNDRHAAPRITYPPHGAVISFDPGIPRANQNMAFEADPARGDYIWALNGREIGSRTPCLWRVQPGEYTLSLLDGDRQTLATVQFAVR